MMMTALTAMIEMIARDDRVIQRDVNHAGSGFGGGGLSDSGGAVVRSSRFGKTGRRDRQGRKWLSSIESNTGMPSVSA